MRVVGEHVGQAHEGGVALGVVGVVALDRGRDRRAAGSSGGRARRRPARGRRRARGARSAAAPRACAPGPWTCLRVAGVGVHEHELADVVQQRGDEQAVAVRRSPAAAASRSAARWTATACRRKRSGAASQVLPRSKNSKVSVRGDEALDGLGREHLDGARRSLSTWPRRGPSACWRAAGRRSRARRRTRSPARRRRSTGRSSETSASTRLRDSASAGKQLERLEGGGQALAVALVARRADDRVRLARARTGATRAAASARARDGVMRSSSVNGRAIRRIVRAGDRRGPCQPLSAPLDGRLSRVRWQAASAAAPVERGVDPRQRLVAARAARRSRRSRARPSCRSSATRSGWKTCLALTPEPLDHARAAPPRPPPASTAPARSRAPSRAAASAVARRSGPSTFSRAAGSSTGPSKKTRASGQNSSSVEIFSCVIATASRRPGAARAAPRAARVSSSSGELAQVAAVHPAQLLLVEHRRRLGDALEREEPLQLLGREERGLLVVAPAEQREVVADRLGQVAGVAQLLHGRGAVALGELLAVGPCSSGRWA